MYCKITRTYERQRGVGADPNTMSALTDVFESQTFYLHNWNCKWAVTRRYICRGVNLMGRVSVFFQQIFNDASKICGGGLSKLNARDVFMIKIHSKKFAPFFVNCYFRVLAWMTMMRKIRPLIFYKIANNRYLKSILLKLSYELNKFYGNIRVCSSILVRSRDGLRASGPRAEAGRAGPGPTKGSNGRGRVLNKNWPNCHL